MIIIYKRYKNKWRIRGRENLIENGVLHLYLGNNVKISLPKINCSSSLKVGSLKIGDNTKITKELTIFSNNGYFDAKIGHDCDIEFIGLNDLCSVGNNVTLKGQCYLGYWSKIQNNNYIRNTNVVHHAIIEARARKK